MYDDHGQELFGHDGRHKPPMADLLTMKGWGGSQGRLAYSFLNRQQESNYSEYALSTMGMLPEGYIIVNSKEVDYDTETAFKVGHNRVAIPVKEFAKQRHITLAEQWELLHPRWIGTYFGIGKQDFFCNKRPSLNEALANAVYAGEMESFMKRFWTADEGHWPAIIRLRQRINDLNEKADEIFKDVEFIRNKIKRIERDIHYCQYTKYHLEGYNVHEYLHNLKRDLAIKEHDMNELRNKAIKIKDYINSITFQNK